MISRAKCLPVHVPGGGGALRVTATLLVETLEELGLKNPFSVT